MKLLFTALLCLLLTGCAAPAETHTESAEDLPLSRKAADSLQQQYGNTVEAVSLPFRDVSHLWNTNAGLLLLNGQNLVLLDTDYQPAASCTLNFAPQITVSGDCISAFDPESRQLLLLSASLQELRCIALPPELSGSPFVSRDGNHVFYATDRGVYGWDLTSGIRRRIRESVFPDQTLTGLHRQDAVLQFRIRENGKERDLFLDAQTGQLLLELAAPAQLYTTDDAYYCIFSSGFLQNLIFGRDPSAPMALFPADPAAEGFFLPQRHAAATLAAASDGTYRLDVYSLDSGYQLDTLTLYHKPSAITEQSDGSLLLSVTEDHQSILLKWVPAHNPSGSNDHTQPYFTAGHPDQEGLTLCTEYARSLSEEYGLEILIWKEAAAVQPWDYTFQPEHRYPVLLSQLQTLNACLSRYPRELLKQTASHFDSLRICLVQSIHGIAGEDSLNTATGIQFLNGSDAHVVLAAGPYLEQALYHELFHVMEIHILSCSNALDRWNELNPAGFSYDLDHGSNARRNSGVYLEGSTRAFVDTYSMSFPKEDRARIFEYAMLPDMDHLFRSETMQRKLSAICSGIRDAYGLKKHPEVFPWEVFLE